MRAALFAIILFAAVASGYFYWWSHIADNLLAALESWEQQRKEEGYEISRTPFELSGFPYRIKLSSQQVNLRNARATTAPALKMESFWLLVQPWNITRFMFGAEQELQASWQDGEDRRIVSLVPERLMGSGRISLDGKIRNLALDLETGQFDFNWRHPVRLARAQLHGRPAPDSHETDIQLAVQIDNMEMIGTEDFALGGKIENLDVTGTLRGLISNGPLHESLEKWRDAGGVMELEKIDMLWGPATIRADGTLTLDELMRPLGAFSATITGYRKILQALAMSGRVPVQTAATAVFGLDLLAKTDAQGVKELTLPVTAQDGGLYLGPVKLMPFGPVLQH